MDFNLRQRLTQCRYADAGRMAEPHVAALWNTLSSLERLADLHEGLEAVIEAALYTLESLGAYHLSEHPYAWL